MVPTGWYYRGRKNSNRVFGVNYSISINIYIYIYIYKYTDPRGILFVTYPDPYTTTFHVRIHDGLGWAGTSSQQGLGSRLTSRLGFGRWVCDFGAFGGLWGTKA